MPALNHHIVAARGPEATARFFIDLLGLDDGVRLGHFVVLKVSNDTTLDFVGVDGEFDRLHYAFLVGSWSPRPSSMRSSVGSRSGICRTGPPLSDPGGRSALILYRSTVPYGMDQRPVRGMAGSALVRVCGRPARLGGSRGGAVRGLGQ